MKRLAWLLTATLLAAPAAASLKRVPFNALNGTVDFLVADTLADLPATGPSDGVQAFVRSENTTYCYDAAAWILCSAGGAGSGTVTNIAVAVPSEWIVSGSPVTTSGTITISEATQADNTVYAGPSAFGPATPSFRALVDGDIPNTITINLAAAATALAANPADCSGADNEFAWRVNASADLSCSGVVAEPLRPSTINVWPASPSSYDDEFTATTLDAQWTATTVTGNATGAGSIGLILSPAAPVRDLTTVPGWFMWQSDSAASAFALVQPWTEDTTSLFLARCQQDQRNYSASQEGSIHFGITVAADTNESVFMWMNTTGSALQYRLQVQNNGAFTEVTSSALSEIQPLSPVLMLMARNGNSYYGFVSHNEGAAWTYLGTVTKSGVVVFDEARIVFIGANETPSPIMGCDYFRFEADNVFPTVTR